MPLNAGDTLLNGQYRILRQIGRGGFGFVYLAQESPLNENVAIKELIPALVGDETTLRRFLAEAKATRRLTHEQIVRTYHVFGEGGNYYIVMEYMPGGSLEERLRTGAPLPVDKAVRMAAQISQGLSYAHERGVVHCDLKPANILFAADDSAKVADFGIAYVSGQMLTRSWMTPVGFVAGTLPYMSPEQTDGVREDPRVDVYALGAVLYRALTGQPYLEFDQRETPRAQADNVQRIYNQQPVPPSTHNRHIPGWLDGVILKALAKRPEDRFPGTAQFRAALLQHKPLSRTPPPAAPPVQAGAKPVPREPTPRPAPAKPRQRSRPAWFWPLVGTTIALLLVCTIAVVLLLSGGGNGKEPNIIQITASPTVSREVTVNASRPTDTPLPLTDTPQPTPFLRSNVVYRVGINPEFPEFEYLDDSGNLVGFDPDLMAAIAETADFQFEFIETEWDGILDDLQTGKFDAVISAVTITEERSEMVRFSMPYFNAGPMIVVRSADTERIGSPEDLFGLSVGIQSGTRSETWALENLKADVISFDDVVALHEALSNGELDAVINDGPTSILVMQYFPELDLAFVGEPLEDELYGVAVNKDRETLLRDINRGLVMIRADGTYDEIYDKWFGLP